ncbi:MAG: glycosyltransferase [Gammaproteobacteria bacterium]
MARYAPSVSIVITCYNYARYVAQAIESALAQTHRATETIVVDDGSTDTSLDVINRYRHRLKIIRQDNCGHVAAVNRGFAASRGEIVLFLDADDLLRPYAVEAVAAAWRPSYTKVQYELDVIDADGHRIGRFCRYVAPYDAAQIQEEFRRFGTYVWPVLSGNAYSRWYLEQLMPLPVARAPDGYLNTLAPLYGSIKVVHEVLAAYRLHDSNLNYQGAAHAYEKRFAQRVSLRRVEVRHLQEHASQRSIELPPGDVLDNELTFVNYRLMLKRLGAPYEGSERDRIERLWWAGLNTLARRPLPLPHKLAHALWLSVLSASPSWLAKRLIDARFRNGPVWRRWYQKRSAQQDYAGAGTHATASRTR